MTSKDKIYHPGWRIRKAYWTTFRVVLSYLNLFLLKKIRGKKYYDKRIMALHIRNAERVKNAILELKGLFIKVGQLLSILSNFLPEAFQKPLEELQDKITPRPFSEVRNRIFSEFGKEPDQLFAYIDKQPVASASIGQVHRARLEDGTEVAVKVQHQNIEKIAKVDLEIIRKINKMVGWFFHINGLDYVYTQIQKMIEEELDFVQEAQSMLIIDGNLKDEKGIFVPKVHLPFSTGRVLTTTWHNGVKIANYSQLDAWKIDKNKLVSKLLVTYCKMVFKDGFYHADPHPGNILVQEDGSLVLLDFGAVAHLGDRLREGIPKVIEAAIKNDTDKMIDICRSMGFLADGHEASEMALKMINALRNFLQNEIKLKGLNFKDIELNPFENSLFDLIQDIGLSGIAGTVQMPKDFVLLNRTLTLLLGISNTLAPSLNPLQVVRPYVKEYVLGQEQNMVDFVTDLVKRSATTVISLPDELHRVLQIIERGRLVTRTPDISTGARLLYKAAQQFLFALLIIAAAVIGYLFHQNGDANYANWSYGLTALFLLLLFRSLRSGNRIKRRLE